ncbi:MAG: carbohydrate ABC transporter permease [Clostridiales bacterium]|jgi:putative aldouronate transport system permease protein|nr:carbohydrate ABC transporter permease [Clostridiales bacterium]
MAKKKVYLEGLEKFNRVSRPTNVILNVLFFLLAFICVVPVVFLVIISFSSEQSISQIGYSFIPQSLSLDAYDNIWKMKNQVFNAIGVSLFVTVVGTIIGVFLTTTMGYVLSRPVFKLKTLMTWIVFIPMIFNGGLVAVYFVNTQALHFKDNIWALILPLLVSSFNVIISKTFFRSTIPDALVESAKIDGASQLKIYFRIVLPISLPVLATIALFLCFGYWNDWYQSLLYIAKENLYSLQALLQRLQKNIEFMAQYASQLGLSTGAYAASMPKESFRMAVAVIIVVPIACAYPFFQKYFISGLTVGAVKG